VSVDPVTFQVVLSRVSGIVQEMQDSIFRTGYSTIVRESQDASCLILDASGDVVGQHVIYPLHVGVLPEVIRAIQARFGDDVHAGDVFITNHPYEAGLLHSMDMAVVTPVVHEGRIVAFCGSIAHKSDLGGVVPGTSNANARELFQEGIQYPPVRYMRGDVVERDVEAILGANSRTPELVLGDLRGQIGCARLGERRIADLIARYGCDIVLDCFRRKHDVTEQRARSAIARWADGSAEAEAFIELDPASEERVRFHVRVEKRGERIRFDFSQTDDQAASPVNIRLPAVRGCCYYALIAMIDTSLQNDGGLARVAEITVRHGSALDPRFPAPVSAYMPTANALTEAILHALSAFVPDKRHARCGLSGGTAIAGTRPDATPFVQYELGGSAYGGIAGFDGLSGIGVLQANARSAPVEVIETEFPTRLLRFELIRDCGGPGEFRGGLSHRRVYEILTNDAQMTLRGGLHRWPALGLDGGKDGRPGRCTLNPGTPSEKALPNRFSGVRLQHGDVVALEVAGGGGLGDPRRRDFQRVLDDVLDGYVGRDAALCDYGVEAERLDAATESFSQASARMAGIIAGTR
jgi:N-methylhydantoinase B